MLFLDEITEMTPAAQESSSGCCRSASSCGSGGRGRYGPTSASSRRRTATCATPSRKGNSGRPLLLGERVRHPHPAVAPAADDIPALAVSFLGEFGHAMDRRPPELAMDAVNALLSYDWPGTFVSYAMCSSARHRL